MICSPIVQLDEFLIYDRRLKCLTFARESFWALPGRFPHCYVEDRQGVIDRRLRERDRASMYDYTDTKYVPGFCSSHERKLSYAMPMTESCHEQMRVLYGELGRLNAIIDIASGPVWFAKKKMLRTRETEGPYIPHAVWHSVLAEFSNGRVKAWTFLVNNTHSPHSIHGSLVATSYIESLVGFDLWPEIMDDAFKKEKAKPQAKFWA